jgi:hypothetical protein
MASIEINLGLSIRGDMVCHLGQVTALTVDVRHERADDVASGEFFGSIKPWLVQGLTKLGLTLGSIVVSEDRHHSGYMP